MRFSVICSTSLSNRTKIRNKNELVSFLQTCGGEIWHGTSQRPFRSKSYKQHYNVGQSHLMVDVLAVIAWIQFWLKNEWMFETEKGKLSLFARSAYLEVYSCDHRLFLQTSCLIKGLRQILWLCLVSFFQGFNLCKVVAAHPVLNLVNSLSQCLSRIGVSVCVCVFILYSA